MVTLPVVLSEMKDKLSVFFIELYVVTLPTGVLYYAACDESITWFIPGTTTSVSYMAVPIEREEVKENVNDVDNKVTLRISNVTDEFTSALMQGYDFRGCDVDIYQIAYPDSITDKDAYYYLYSGIIDAPSLDCGKATFEMSLCKRIPNLHSERTISINCNAWFGDDDECGAVKNSITGTTKTTSTSTIIYANNIGTSTTTWKNGTLTIGYESKKVKTCGSTNGVGWVKVEYPFYEDTVGKSFSLTQGCDRTPSECARYNNTKNYGGFPSVSLNYGIKYS